MKILIIDRDTAAIQLLAGHLQQAGHTVASQVVRKDAMDLLEREDFDVVFIDPAPLTSVRPITLPLRWEQRNNYPYLIQISHELNVPDAVHCGLNDVVSKPLHWPQVAEKLENAKELIGFMAHLQGGEQIQSDGTIFGKRSFGQLMLSALDRTYRYAEQAYLLMIQVHGLQGRPEMQEKLAHYLTRLHRLSDFLGRTDADVYALLILRPAIDTEPLDAADRFHIALQDFQQAHPELPQLSFNLTLRLLPSGSLVRHYDLPSGR